jgi:DNA-binding transcriptional LysR family regulator
MELLRGFEAAARHLSFTRAAKELHLTQSAVSRQVRQLEAQLGARLFQRSTRSLALTDVGYAYYTEVQRLLRQLGEATRRVRTTRAERLVRVTTTPTFASLWLIPRLSDFQTQHPQIDVRVVAENVLRDLQRDDFDLAVRYSTRVLAGPRAVKLFDERLVPLCSPKLAAGKLLRKPQDLRGHFLIHFNDLDGYAPWLSWETWFAGAGIAPLEGKGALYFSHYDQAIRAALAGQGVALGRVPVVDHLLKEGRLVAPFGRRVQVTLEDKSYWLIGGERQRERREVKAFCAWLLAARQTQAFANSRRQTLASS